MVLSPPAPSQVAGASPRDLARFHGSAARDRGALPGRSRAAAERRVAPAFPHFPPAAAAVAALGARACRWPLGEPVDDDFAFCGAARLPRGSYCAVHARLAAPARARPVAVRRGGRA